jgi:hypothetical protein
MKEKEFQNALLNAQLTKSALVDTINHVAESLDVCTPETAGEILNDAVAIVGIAHQLLIDINNLNQAV